MSFRFSPWSAGAAMVVAACVMSAAGASARQLPIEPLRESGQNIDPAFEGWYQNSDGTYSLLIGYYNRNKKEALDIPIGPDNRIEPGGPDQGQPTHFEVGRGWGILAIKVPKDFGDKKITWTLTANGKTVAIPFGLTKGYQVEPYKDAAMGNTPPTLKFASDGAAFQGPPLPLSQAPAIGAVVNEPTPIDVWITDLSGAEAQLPAAGGGPRAPRLSVTLTKYRGPGAVKFTENKPTIKEGKATTNATFSLPGEYLIRVEGNDSSGVGGGGFQCCWTTAYLKVAVKPATTGGK